MKDIKGLIKIPLTLLLICGVTALVLAAVNSVTKGPIADAELAKREAAIKKIFENAQLVTDITDRLEDNEGVYAVYEAKSRDTVEGYVVHVGVGNGYGGEITMMVGIYPDLSVAGLEIIEHSETAGLGANIEKDSFRDSFKGLFTHAVIGENVDALSGATISSKAVAEGVNTALDAASTLLSDTQTTNVDVTTDRQTTAPVEPEPTTDQTAIDESTVNGESRTESDTTNTETTTEFTSGTEADTHE